MCKSIEYWYFEGHISSPPLPSHLEKPVYRSLKNVLGLLNVNTISFSNQLLKWLSLNNSILINYGCNLTEIPSGSLSTAVCRLILIVYSQRNVLKLRQTTSETWVCAVGLAARSTKGGGGRSNACSEEELARKPAERIPPRVFAFGGTREHFDPATKVPAHYKGFHFPPLPHMTRSFWKDIFTDLHFEFVVVEQMWSKLRLKKQDVQVFLSRFRFRSNNPIIQRRCGRWQKSADEKCKQRYELRKGRVRGL